MTRPIPTVAFAVSILATALVWPTSGVGPDLLLGWLRTTGPGVVAAALVLFAAWGAGRLVRGRISRDLLADDPVAAAFVDLAVGLAVLQSGAVLLGILGLFGVWPARALVLAGLAAAIAAVPDRVAARPGWLWGPVVFVAALLFPTLLRMGAPGTGPDELQYHVRFVRHLVELGSFAGHVEDPLSGLAQGMHGLLALAWSLGGEPALRPFAVGLAGAGLWAGARVAGRIGGRHAALLYIPIVLGAASLLRFVPVVGTDTPLMLFLAAALLLLLAQQQQQHPTDRRTALLLGLLGGAAFSIKYTAALYLAPVWLMALVLAARRDTRTAAWTAASALIPLLFAAPWLLENVRLGSHPLFPLAGLTVPAGMEAAYRFNLEENYGAGAGLGAWLRTPWDLFVLGHEFDRRHFLGRLSPWPLLLAPVVLARLRDPGIRLLAVVVTLGLAGWAGPLRRVVYLLPIWPLIAAMTAAALAGALASLGRERSRRAAMVAGALLALAAVAEVADPWKDGLAAAPVATGRQSAEAWIAERVDSAPAWAWVRDHVPPGEVVTTAFMWRLLPTGHAQRWACAEECTMVRLALMEAGTGEGARRRLESMGSRWLVVRAPTYIRSGYPGLTDEQFERGYALPLRVLEELTTLHARLRFSQGRYAVYELPEKRLPPLD